MLERVVLPLIVSLMASLFACGETSVGPASAQARGDQTPHLRILFIGNSHTAMHRLPLMVESMLEASDAKRPVDIEMIVGGFLADHVQNEKTLARVREGKWDVVVLQAQKYSQSGRFTYPHDGAVTLTRLARDAGAKVLMFPEWGQAGRDEEGGRVHKLHEAIAAETGAKVVPIGLAWDRALAARPDLKLHAHDGNHSSPAGAYLTACVFFAWLADRNPAELGGVAAPSTVAPSTRRFLQTTAWETVQANRKEDKSDDKDDDGEGA